MDIIKWADSSAWCVGKILNSLFPIAVSSVVEKVAEELEVCWVVLARRACSVRCGAYWPHLIFIFNLFAVFWGFFCKISFIC